MPAMRIALLSATFLTNRGGAELYAHRLAGELAGLGHDVTVWTSEGPLPLPSGLPFRVEVLDRDERRERAARRWLALGCRRGGYRLVRWLFRSGRRQLLADGPFCPGLQRKGIFRNADVLVLVRGGGAWPVQLARVMAGRPVPLTVAVPLLHVAEGGAVPPVLRRLYAPYDLILALTEYERDWMRRHGWGADRIRVAGAGSDETTWPVAPGEFRRRHGVPQDAPLFVFVGRKIYNKGVQHLIAAMDRVWDVEPRARLALLGFSHNPPGWIQGLVGQLRHPAEGRILDLDDVEEREREQALEDGDVFCLPSIGDSFGIAYLDAWRHRKPVMGCRGCSSESIIAHGKTGVLVEFGNVEEIAGAMLTLWSDAPHRNAMGEAGFQEWKQKWTWDRVARRVETEFLEALAGGGTGHRREGGRE
ncbi:MAG: glycosyltransferase family 4 protein [Kiritimatiellae bacterium]|nr:glycosyltransferase family 4 protein [Kiritimatiellia bacterium]